MQVSWGKKTNTMSKKEKFNDYDGFVEKFKPKKTTDDCYTPAGPPGLRVFAHSALTECYRRINEPFLWYQGAFWQGGKASV